MTDAVTTRLRRGHRRHRARRARPSPTCSPPRVVGDHPREGPQPPARARAAVRAARRLLQRRDQVHAPPLPRPRSAARAAHLPPHRGRRRPPVHRRGQQPAVDGRRRRLPRRRQAPPLPRGRLPPALASSGRSTAPTSPTGRSTTTSSSRTTPRPSGSSASPATPARTRSRRGAAGPYPMPPGPDMFGAVLTSDAADRARAAPVPRADRRELRRLRRPAGVQQLRVLRVLRLPDPRQGRPDRAAAPRAAHRPVRDPARGVRRPRSCSTAAGRRATRRALPRRRDGDATREVRRGARRRRRRRVRDAAPAAALRRRQLVRPRRPLPHVPLPDVRRSASSRSRLHGERGRSVTHLTTTSSSPTPARWPPRATPGCRGSAAASSSTAAAGAADQGGDAPTRRARSTRSSMRDSPIRDRLWAFTHAGRGPAAGRRTASTSTRRCATCGASPPGGSPTRRTATSSWRREHWAPILEAVMRDAGAEFDVLGDVAAAGRRDRRSTRWRPAPISRHVMGTCRMGDDPRTSVCRPLAAASTTSRTCCAPTRRCS